VKIRHLTIALTTICFIAPMLASAANSSQDGSAGAITIGAFPSNYKGSCPVEIHFRATIYGDSHSEIQYRWERGGHKMTRERSGELVNGKLELHDSFSVGQSRHTFVAINRLRVLCEGARREFVTQQIKSTGTCTQ
jgi:hypothetical protein